MPTRRWRIFIPPMASLPPCEEAQALRLFVADELIEVRGHKLTVRGLGETAAGLPNPSAQGGRASRPIVFLHLPRRELAQQAYCPT